MARKDSGVTVTGRGEAAAPPDLATVDLGVSVLAPTVADATRRATDQATAMIAALKDRGVAPSDMSTLAYTMSTEHDWVDNQQRFLGYRVTNTVRTVIRSVTQVGETIDAAVAAGGGDAQVNNLVFSIEDDTALLAAARDSAWDDAQAKATQLASLAGRSLGKALSIVERTRPIPGPFPVARMRTESDAGTPIEGGTSVVVIDLEVRYELS